MFKEVAFLNITWKVSKCLQYQSTVKTFALFIPIAIKKALAIEANKNPL